MVPPPQNEDKLLPSNIFVTALAAAADMSKLCQAEYSIKFFVKQVNNADRKPSAYGPAAV